VIVGSEGTSQAEDETADEEAGVERDTEAVSREQRWSKYLGGPRFVIATAATVLIGVVVPTAWNKVQETISKDLKITATESHGEGRLLMAAATVIDRADARRIPDLLLEGPLREEVTTAGIQHLTVVVEGNGSGTVTITDIRARVDRIGSPIAGTLFQIVPQGGEPKGVFGLNLASPDPVARELADGAIGPEGLGDRYFGRQTYPLEKGKATVFEVIAFPARHTYEWHLEVTSVNDGKLTTTPVRDKTTGNDFKITGLAKKYKGFFSSPASATNYGWRYQDPQTMCSKSASSAGTCTP
jgi:hypothetical protein